MWKYKIMTKKLKGVSSIINPSARSTQEAHPAAPKRDSPHYPAAAGGLAPRRSAASSPLLPIQTNPGTDIPRRRITGCSFSCERIAGCSCNRRTQTAAGPGMLRRNWALLRSGESITWLGCRHARNQCARAHRESSFLAAGGREDRANHPPRAAPRASSARKKNLAVAARKGREGKGGRWSRPCLLFLVSAVYRKYPWRSLWLDRI